jgi:HEAT repeat protein
MRAALTGVLTLSIFFVAYAEGAEVRDLIAKLKDKDSDVRRAAAKELSELGEEAKPAVADLTRALRDKDLFVRRFSAEALGNIGEPAKSAIPALAASMNDERKEVAEAAADAIGKMGTAGIAALTSAVKDPTKDPNIRRKAAVGLGKIGLQARGAVPALTDVLSGKVKMRKGKGGNDDDIRIEVATALGSIAKADDKAAVEALKSVSEGKQRNKALAKAAGDALRQITGEGPKKKKKK